VYFISAFVPNPHRLPELTDEAYCSAIKGNDCVQKQGLFHAIPFHSINRTPPMVSPTSNHFDSLQNCAEIIN
jgi:hypothetical protein